MKTIPLTQGRFAIADDEWFERLNRYKWYFANGYARRNVGTGYISMHRTVLSTPAGHDTDHINRDKLDNRRSNLRVATRAENTWNTVFRPPNKTGFKGVHFDKQRKKFRVSIWFNGKRFKKGRFATAKEAGAVYAACSEQMHGAFHGSLQK